MMEKVSKLFSMLLMKVWRTEKKNETAAAVVTSDIEETVLEATDMKAKVTEPSIKNPLQEKTLRPALQTV